MSSNPLHNQNDNPRPVPAINWFIEIDGVKYYEILEAHIENARPGQYINEQGMIYDKHNGRFRHPSMTAAPYMQVTIHLKNGKNYVTSLHRILMLVFRYEYGCEKKVVNHIDGDKHNNSFDNLEWCTYKENTIHAYKSGLMNTPVGEDSALSKLTNEQVHEICSELEKPRYRGQFKELSKKYGVDRTIITGIAKGKIWRSISEKYNLDYSEGGLNSNLLTPSQVREICEELSKSRYPGQAKELADKYNINPYIIIQIANRTNWNYISKDYIFAPPFRASRRFTEDQIHIICQVLQEFGKLDKEVYEAICNRLDITELDSNSIQSIRRIYKRDAFDSITSQYKW